MYIFGKRLDCHRLDMYILIYIKKRDVSRSITQENPSIQLTECTMSNIIWVQIQLVYLCRRFESEKHSPLKS